MRQYRAYLLSFRVCCEVPLSQEAREIEFICCKAAHQGNCDHDELLCQISHTSWLFTDSVLVRYLRPFVSTLTCMATLTRTRILSDDADVEVQHDIRLGIPTPFPTTVKTEQDDVLEPIATGEPLLDEVPPEVGEVLVEGVETSSRHAVSTL